VITRHVDVGPEAETTMATSYWFNVLDYGATANGVTDDTTAIQTAINTVPSSGGSAFSKAPFPPAPRRPRPTI
jgi:polygalacturonase